MHRVFFLFHHRRRDGTDAGECRSSGSADGSEYRARYTNAPGQAALEMAYEYVDPIDQRFTYTSLFHYAARNDKERNGKECD